MTVYEIPNINHCTVTPISSGGNVLGYRINANEGWYIHLPEHAENSYTTVVVLLASRDFSTVQIIAEADLPPDAEFNGNTGNKDNEVM